MPFAHSCSLPGAPQTGEGEVEGATGEGEEGEGGGN